MSAATAGTSYRALLLLPHARRLFGAAAVGRLGYAVLPLAIFFTVRDASASFGVAGLVVAASNLTVVVSGPVRSRLIDRYGRRTALPVLALGYAAASVGLVLGAMAHLPLAALIGLGALAGALPPPLGPSMRAIWAQLAPEADLRRRAYSLDAVTEEILFTAGPLLTGLALAISSPRVGVFAGLALIVGGALGLSRGPRLPTSPAVATPRSGFLLRRPGFAAMLLTVAGVSSALGLTAVLVPVSAVHAGHQAIAGPLEALVAAGSAIGGLAYGRRAWRLPAPVLQWRLCLGLAVVGGWLAMSPNLYGLGAGLLLAGLTFAPTLIIAYTLADRLTPDSARVEASGWVNTASNAGGALGTAVAGLAADHAPAWILYLAVGAVPLTVASLATRRVTAALGGPAAAMTMKLAP